MVIGMNSNAYIVSEQNGMELLNLFIAQASLILPLVEGQLNSGITLAAVAKESITWTSVEAARQPFCGWMTKPI